MANRGEISFISMNRRALFALWSLCSTAPSRSVLFVDSDMFANFYFPVTSHVPIGRM